MPAKAKSATATVFGSPIASLEMLFFLFLACLFGQLFLALWPSWNDGTYYDYGLLVPVVGPYFFWCRWREVAGARRSTAEELARLGRVPSTWVLLFPAFLFLTLLRLVESVDSGWRAPLYLHWFTVWVLTGWFLGKLFGARKAVTFLPVAILTLLSVPLPSAMEFSLIRGLTEGVVEVSVTANRYMGFPVIHSGETLFANDLPLHVSEGCSGIRSFQSSVFAAFVVGEFLRLGWVTRIALILCGVFFAFLSNSVRVIHLVRHAFVHGDENLQSLHDTSGYVSLGFTIAFIFAAGLLLEKIASKPSASSDSVLREPSSSAPASS